MSKFFFRHTPEQRLKELVEEWKAVNEYRRKKLEELNAKERVN